MNRHLVNLHDEAEIEAFARRNPFHHLYLHLGFEKVGDYEGLTLNAKDAVDDHQIPVYPALP